MRAAVGRADLMRLVADLPAERAARVAALLGFEAPVDFEEAPDAVALPAEVAPAQPSEPARAAPAGAPVRFWRLEEMTFADEPDPKPVSVAVERSGGLTEDDFGSPGCSLFATPQAPPLTTWSRLWPVLRAALQAPVDGRDPDVPALVRAWGRGEVVRRVPRVVRRAWSGRASVWVDRSARLVPFWSDQADVWRRLRKVCGQSGFDVRLLDGHRQAQSMARRGDLLAGSRPDASTPVLVLGDLGAYGSPVERAAWLRTARGLRRAGVRIAALVPGPETRWDPSIGKAWAALSWERGRRHDGAGGRGEPRFWEERTERLLRLASPAAFVQPGLLRALRRLLPAWQADAATEADLWSHADVRAADATGLVLHTEAASRWRTEFAAGIEPGLLAGVSALIGRWHGGLPRELLRAETLVWHALAPNAAPPGDLEDARGFARRLAETARGGDGSDPAHAAAVRRYGRALLGAMPASAYDALPGLGIVWAASFQGVEGVAVPPNLDPRALYAELGRASEPRWWAARQVGSHLVFTPSPGTAWPSHVSGPGSPVAWLLAAEPEVWAKRGPDGPMTQHVLAAGLSIPLYPGQGVALHTDRCAVTIACWHREPWAKAAGRDRFGLWAEAEVKGVAVRFRWIPPGRFRMGSPESEAGRFGDEGPQHLVTWTRGRWLGTTPVTQALWEAVMGKNPSQFKSAERPVENVSWEDCETFVARLDGLVEGLAPRLPSEAEWEHACRAGTATATWLGDLEIRGENDAPLLDPIAWYGGNCGVDFDLPGNGFDTSKWPKKQHQHAEGGTRLVGRKDANPFGLHDMLGNVYEWCVDAWNHGDGYPEGDATDPPTGRMGSGRVLRGGSWHSFAGSVRAAYRFANAPANRDGSLGFRLARGQGPGPEPGTRSGLEARGAGRGPGSETARDAPSPTGTKKRRKAR